MFSLRLFFCILLLPAATFAQRSKQDTTYRAGGDTMVVRFSDSKNKWTQNDFYKRDVDPEDGYVSYDLVKSIMINRYTDGGWSETEYDMRRGVSKRVHRKEFFPGGQLKISGDRIKSRDEGVRRTWYQNGNPQCICFYRNGKRDSVQLIHDSLGRLELRADYKAGKPHGRFTYYDSLGRVSQTEQYVDGKQEGLAVYYHPDGKIWSEIVYKNDRLWDVISNNDVAGKPRDKGTLQAGTGTRIVYNENGIPEEKEYYKKGKLKRTESLLPVKAQ